MPAPMTSAWASVAALAADTALLMSLIVWPWPSSPTWTIVSPIASKAGRARANAASSPPAMIVSVPLWAFGEEPVTGASTNAWPRSASARADTTRVGGRDRRHVDEQRLLRRAGGRAVLAEQDRLDLRAVDDHRDDDVGARRGLGRRGGGARALVLVGPRLRLAGGPRPRRHREALALQVRGHPRAHDAQSQEADARHGRDPSDRTWRSRGCRDRGSGRGLEGARAARSMVVSYAWAACRRVSRRPRSRPRRAAR